MIPVIFIVGPTASGKSDTSFLLAKELGGEIVSADSMLVYQEPAIITSKPSSDTLSKIAHHFIGIISVRETYSVFDYFRSSTDLIRKLYFKNKPVIVCGGSGLYVKAIVDGIFEGSGRNDKLRQALQTSADLYGRQYLYQELEKVDNAAAKRISPQDLKRIIRALEVYYQTGIPISQKQSLSFGLWEDLPIKLFGLRLSRRELYRRIEERVEQMFNQGAVDEVEALRQENLSLTAGKIIGIKEIGELLDGKATASQAKANMKKNTRHLAKRQITWFKKDKRIEWLDIDNLTSERAKDEILRRINTHV